MSSPVFQCKPGLSEKAKAQHLRGLAGRLQRVEDWLEADHWTDAEDISHYEAYAARLRAQIGNRRIDSKAMVV